MSKIVHFPTTILFVAIISINVIFLGSITINRTFEIHPPAVYALQRGVAAAGVTTLIDKGNALFNQGNYAQAIQYYDKALSIDANDKVALNGKGASLNSLGSYSQAIPL